MDSINVWWPCKPWSQTQGMAPTSYHSSAERQVPRKGLFLRSKHNLTYQHDQNISTHINTYQHDQHDQHDQHCMLNQCWRLLKTMSCDATWSILSSRCSHRLKPTSGRDSALKTAEHSAIFVQSTTDHITCTTQRGLWALSWHMVSSTDNDLAQQWTVNTHRQEYCSNWQNAQVL